VPKIKLTIIRIKKKTAKDTTDKEEKKDNETTSESDDVEEETEKKDKRVRFKYQENMEKAEVREKPRKEFKRRGGRDREGQSDNRTLHVANLPTDVSAEKLRNTFTKFGDVYDVRLVDGKNFAYVEFRSSTDAAEVVALTEPITYVDASTTSQLKVSFAYGVRPGLKLISSLLKPSATPASPAVKKYGDQLTLFVLNLAFCTTDEQLKNFLLKESGGLTAQGNPIKIKETRIVRNRDTGKSRGIAYVEFEDVDSLDKVLSTCNGKSLDNFTLKIEISKPPTKTSSHSDAPTIAPKHFNPKTPAQRTVEKKEKWSKYAPDPTAKLDLKDSSNNTKDNAMEVELPKEKPKKTMVPRAIKKKEASKQ